VAAESEYAKPEEKSVPKPVVPKKRSNFLFGLLLLAGSFAAIGLLLLVKN
jgi:hypothetical protein